MRQRALSSAQSVGFVNLRLCCVGADGAVCSARGMPAAFRVSHCRASPSIILLVVALPARLLAPHHECLANFYPTRTLADFVRMNCLTIAQLQSEDHSGQKG